MSPPGNAILSLQYLPGETRAFLEEDGRLEGLAILRDSGPLALGTLLLGRVRRLDRRLNAAFVALPQGPDGFLPLSEAPATLSEGTLLALRVTRVAAEDKGPRLTGKLESRERAPASGDEPRVLQRGGSLLPALAARAALVRADDPAAFALVPEGMERQLLPAGLPEQAAWDQAIDALLQPEVALEGGGSLIVETGRTLCAIDVNLGSGEAAAVNEAAARALARQLRLRALGGRVVIDFLDSHESGKRAAVERTLKEALAQDPERVKTLGWSRGGLYELTRRRSQPALHEILLEPAGDYGNRRKRAATLAFEALRALAAAARARPAAALALSVAPAVGAFLADHPARRYLEQRLGRTIALDVDATEPFTLALR